MKELSGQELTDALAKLKECKKRDKIANKRMSDEELSGIAGGFWEDRGGFAQGYQVICPFCHRTSVNDFSGYVDYDQRIDVYTCVEGHVFAIDEYGVYYY